MGSIPVSDTHDYTPTALTEFRVGDVMFMSAEKTGEVLAAIDGGGGVWVYAIEVDRDGVPTVEGAALITGDLTGTGYDYMAVSVATAKPVEGATFTATDLSAWVYPNDGTGQYLCYLTGTLWFTGDRADSSDIEGLVAD